MVRRWKYADQVTLLMWASKVKVPSRTTPRLLTWGEGGTGSESETSSKGQKVDRRVRRTEPRSQVPESTSETITLFY